MDAVELLIVVSIVGACLFSLLGRPIPEESTASRRRVGPALPTGVAGRVRGAVRTRPQHGWRPRAFLIDGVEPEGQVLFAQRTGSRGIALDCLIRPRPHDGGHGVPARVSARCTVTWWAAERFTRMVEAWATDHQRTTVRIAERAGGLRAVVSHGRSTVTLDVVDPMGLLMQLRAPVGARGAVS